MSHVVFSTARFVTALMSYGSIQRMEEAIFGEPCCTKKYVDVSENNGTPKSSSLIGCSIINHVHPFFGVPLFLETPKYVSYLFIVLEDNEAFRSFFNFFQFVPTEGPYGPWGERKTAFESISAWVVWCAKNWGAFFGGLRIQPFDCVGINTRHR